MSGRLVALGPGVNAGTAAALAEADWRRHDLGALRIHWSGGLRAVAATPRLLLLGQLFGADDRPIDALGEAEEAAILATGMRRLTERYWGRYLAIWRDPRDDAAWALRDPSGAVPLFINTAIGPTLFTDPADALALGLASADIDWPGVAHRLHYPQLPAARTGWTGIEELLPGQAIRLDAPSIRHPLWSPWTFAAREPDAPDAPARIASAVTRAVRALTAGPGPLLLELSGGLDSSILAACLAEAGASCRAATLVTPGRDGDERVYARLIAERFGLPLEEIPLDPDQVDLLAGPRLVRAAPGGFGMIDCVDRAQTTAADRIGARALVSGTGGDNVFCSLRSAAPVLDALRAGGPRRAWAAARDLARLSATPLPDVVRALWRYRRLDGREPDRWRVDRQFLSGECRPALVRHPWLDAPIGRPAGARAHVVLLLRAHALVAALDRARIHDMVFPLLSQPVMEACLALGSWCWIEGGRDRAVSRAAFADRLPRAVIARRTKGRLESLLVPAFDRDRARLGALLLDGRLAGHGLLDRRAIETAVRFPAGADDERYTRLLFLADAELWARSLDRAPPLGQRPPPLGAQQIVGIGEGSAD